MKKTTLKNRIIIQIYFKRDPDSYESYLGDKKAFKEIYIKLNEIFQNAFLNLHCEINASKNENKTLNSPTRTKPVQNDLALYQYSGVELLTHFAFKHSMNECIAIGRTIESKNNFLKTFYKKNFF